MYASIWGWVRNVILIKYMFGSGKLRGVGIFGWELQGLNNGTRGQFTSNRGTRWTDPVTARRVPSKCTKGNKRSKGSKGNKGNKGSKK